MARVAGALDTGVFLPNFRPSLSTPFSHVRPPLPNRRRRPRRQTPVRQRKEHRRPARQQPHRRPVRAEHHRTGHGRALGRVERPLLPHAGLRHRRAARTHHRQDRHRRRTGRAATARPPAVPMRGYERDELLQHQPRDAGAGGLPEKMGRRARTRRQETQACHRLRHAAFLARFRRPDRQGRHRERLRRGPLRKPALDAGVEFRGAVDRRAGGHRHHRQPQPAARLRLQGVLRRGRADRRTAGQRDHRGGQRGDGRGVRSAARRGARGNHDAGRGDRRGVPRTTQDARARPGDAGARGPTQNCVYADPRHGGRGDETRARSVQAALHDGAGAGRDGRAFPDGPVAQPGERRGVEPGHEARRRTGRGPGHRHRPGRGPHGRGRARSRMGSWCC